MADAFDQYAMAGAWDEMFERPGEPRPAYRALFATLQPLSVTDLRPRADQLARVFTDRGVTFAYAGEERPFPLDCWTGSFRARRCTRRTSSCGLRRAASSRPPSVRPSRRWRWAGRRFALSPQWMIIWSTWRPPS